MTSRSQIRDLLRKVGEQDDDDIDLAEAALLLAALDRPRGDRESYRLHLAELVQDLAGQAQTDDSVASRVAAIKRTMVDRYGYRGDTQTYEDLQNANLMSVIDRRRGLPVALGILFLHTARGQGWSAVGLNFPGHFLIRMDWAGERTIIDPFNQSNVCTAADLRELLKASAGAAAELEPEHYAPVGNRHILLRLQNNLKLRHLRNGMLDRAAEILQDMLLFAPQEASLWRETGLLRARLGDVQGAIDALEIFMDIGTHDQTLHQTALILQQLRNRLV